MALADQVERAGGAPKAEDATLGILHPKSDES